ncbi:HAD-IIA family hydrolase [Rothia uropygioeca]|uniref:HAD-IIA family hydrolase n=1 Tax=Kocuria sp. 257 TaxID=2021970 RepID=UPI003425CB4C
MTSLSMSALISSFDAILSDLDGVVYAGPHPIDGAVDSLNRAETEGVSVAYVTNNASRSVEAVAEHLNSLGLTTDGEHVVSSAQSAAQLAVDQLPDGATVGICGSEALAECARTAGLKVVGLDESPQAVLQGFDPGLGWQDLANAAYALASDEVLWIVSNTDMTIPKERGIAPGNGTLVHAVSVATRREPFVAGKPGAKIFQTIVDRLGVERPVVVGDRLDTDIFGAHQAGLPSIAVMTGVQSMEDLVNARTAERPTYVLSNLRELFEEYRNPQIEVRGHSAVAVIDDVARAVAEGATLRIETTAGSTQLLAWRTAMAAWWTAHPDEATATRAEIQWA